MWHLVQAELYRFRRPVFWAGLAHLGILITAVASTGDNANDRIFFAVCLSYGLLGLLFGAAQVYGYRRKGLWAFLLHRPSTPVQVLHALLIAAVLLLLAVLAGPWLLVVLGLEASAGPGVETRTLLLLPWLFGHVLVCYLIGLLVVLRARRAGALVIALPLLYLGLTAAGWWSGLVLLAVLTGLYALARSALQPAIDAPPRAAVSLIGRALAIQLALFGALWFAGNMSYATVVAVQEHGWRSFARHSWNEYFAPGTYARLSYLYGDAALAHGLRLEQTPRSRQLLAALKPAALKPAALGPADQELDSEEKSVQRTVRWWRRSLWQQPPFQDRDQVLADPAGVQWTLRHDQRAFYGRDIRDNVPRGWLGLKGRAATPEEAGRFETVPRVWGDAQLVTDRRVYSFDSDRQRFETRFEAPANETLLAPLIDHNGFASVLTDRALYLLVPGSTGEVLSVPWPEALRHLLHVVITPYPEDLQASPSPAFVVAFAYGTLSERDLGPARQIVGVLHGDSSFETVVDQPLAAGPPAWLRHWNFLQAPLLQTGANLARALLLPEAGDHARLGDLLHRPPPTPILAAALLIALLAAGTTFGLARRRGLSGRGLSRRDIRLWTLITLMTSLPGLCSFLLLSRGD